MNLKTRNLTNQSTEKLFVFIGLKANARRETIANTYTGIRKIRFQHVSSFWMMAFVKKGKSAYIAMSYLQVIDALKIVLTTIWAFVN